MRYDRVAKLIETTETSDGMGGVIETETESIRFSVHMAPLPHELTLQAYGYDVARDSRLFTTQALDVGDKVDVDGELHKVVNVLKAGRRYSMVVSRL